MEGSHRIRLGDLPHQHPRLSRRTLDAQSAVRIAQELSRLRIHAHQSRRKEECQSDWNETNCPLGVVEVQQITVGLGSTVELADVRKIEAATELGPDSRTESVPDRDAHVMRRVGRSGWLREEVAADFADVLNDLQSGEIWKSKSAVLVTLKECQLTVTL